jgi:hypothetical protein
VSQVRVATSPTTLPDDPDKDGLTDKTDAIVYGTLQVSNEVLAWAAGAQKKLPIPLSAYSGISVDPHFLWIYRQGGLACATHASVMSEKPRWLGQGNNNIAGIRDLSSCEDGTLFVSSFDRLLTAVYRVDFPAGSVIIYRWDTLVGGGARPGPEAAGLRLATDQA